MKTLKSIKYAVLTLVILISGCSEEPTKPSNELSVQKPPSHGESWWNVTLPKDFDAKRSKGVWLVVRDYHGSIIGHSAVVLSPDMEKSVKVIILKTEPGQITVEVSDLNGTGATLPIAKSTELDLLETRESGKGVNMGDTLVKWKIKDSPEKKSIPNTARFSTLQEGEARLSLEEYQDKD
jgi:hypothetical protein